MPTLFEQKIRETEFFKYLEAMKAQPVFAPSPPYRQALFFVLPSVALADEAVKDIKSHFTSRPGIVRNIFDDFNGLPPLEKILTDKRKDEALSGPHCEVYDNYTNVVRVAIDMPHKDMAVRRYVSAFDKMMRQGCSWLGDTGRSRAEPALGVTNGAAYPPQRKSSSIPSFGR